MSDDRRQRQPAPDNQDPKRPMGPNVKVPRNLVSWVVLLGLAMVLVALLNNQLLPTAEYSISEFDALIRDGKVKSLRDQGRRNDRGDQEGSAGGRALRAPVAFRVNYPREAIDKSSSTTWWRRFARAVATFAMNGRTNWCCCW